MHGPWFTRCPLRVRLGLLLFTNKTVEAGAIADISLKVTSFRNVPLGDIQLVLTPHSYAWSTA